MKIIKAKMVIGTFASGKREFEVPVTEYASIDEAVNELGKEQTLKFINYAQRLNDLGAAREKNLTLHKGPEDFKTKRLR